jgi:hypothetical protein
MPDRSSQLSHLWAGSTSPISKSKKRRSHVTAEMTNAPETSGVANVFNTAFMMRMGYMNETERYATISSTGCKVAPEFLKRPEVVFKLFLKNNCNIYVLLILPST